MSKYLPKIIIKTMKKRLLENKFLEDDIKSLEKEIESNEIKYKLEKKKFIEELKDGVGEQIKIAPNEVMIIQPKKITFKEKLINFFKKF